MSTGRVWHWAQLIVFTAGILARAFRATGGGVTTDEVEVARVHEESRGLAEHEHRIPPVDRVGQERHAAAQREIPEVSRDHALALALGRDPLDEKARREERLAEKADAEPELIRGHRHPLSVARAVARAAGRRGLGPLRPRRAHESARSRAGRRIPTRAGRAAVRAAGHRGAGAPPAEPRLWIQDARPNMARRTLYALRTSSGRRRPETRAKIFSASSVGTVLLLSPTSVRSRRGTSSATETR